MPLTFCAAAKPAAMQLIDLHMHSTFSDGTRTPAELVRTARENGLAAVAITDHDTIEGAGEALAAGEQEGIMVLPGVEISAYLDDVAMHILGYGFDPLDAGLNAEIATLQKLREERNGRILENFKRLGFAVNNEDLAALAKGQIGRPHFAELLVRFGAVRNIDEAFRLYLRKNGAAYAAKEKHDARQVIAAISNAGGVAVLAHPVSIDASLKSLPHLLVRLKQAGLAGLEVYYPSQNPAMRRRLIDMAGRYGLLITGGSDHHGPERSLPMAGRPPGCLKVPLEILWPINQLARHPARNIALS